MMSRERRSKHGLFAFFVSLIFENMMQPIPVKAIICGIYLLLEAFQCLGKSICDFIARIVLRISHKFGNIFEEGTFEVEEMHSKSLHRVRDLPVTSQQMKNFGLEVRGQCVDRINKQMIKHSNESNYIVTVNILNLIMKVASFHLNSRHAPSRTEHSLANARQQFLAQFFDNSGSLKPEYQKVTYPDGGEYIGQYQDCRCGKGIYSFPNKDIYMGSWKQDKFNADGLYIYTTGQKYQGKFLDGKKHGRGTYHYKSGAVYDGEWHKDRKNGFGIYTYPNGEKYEGNWLNGEKHGKGAYYYKNGDKYIGDWIKNKKNGHGVLEYLSGAVYDGEWIDDKASNKGEIIYANKDKYQGNFLNGKKHGKGIYHYQSGGKYKGEWLNDKKHGYGVIDYANGDRYQGTWKNGERAEHGIYEYSNGDVYDGEWRNDLKEGHGKLDMATGDKYEGEWQGGKKNGSGLYIFANGDIYEGEFENGNRQGQGTYTWTDQSYYKGEWLADKMNGKGIYANSEIELEGYFENDNFVRPLQ